MWLADGQRIALSSDGSRSIAYDTVSGAILLGGPVHFTAAPVLPAYAVAALPSVSASGAKAYASDGRKPGEAAGSGTGVEVFVDRTARWISVLSGTPVLA